MGASLCWAAALPLSLHLACKAEAKVQFVFVQKVLSAVCDATCQKPCRQAVQALTSVCCLCVSAAAWCAALLCFCSSCCSLSDRSALRFCSVAISAAASAAASSASLDCCRRPLNCLQDNNNSNACLCLGHQGSLVDPPTASQRTKKARKQQVEGQTVKRHTMKQAYTLLGQICMHLTKADMHAH